MKVIVISRWYNEEFFAPFFLNHYAWADEVIILLEKTSTEFIIKFLKHDKHFIDETDTRDIYEVTLKRGERSFTFNFGNSIIHSGEYIFFEGTGRERIILSVNGTPGIIYSLF